MSSPSVMLVDEGCRGLFANPSSEGQIYIRTLPSIRVPAEVFKIELARDGLHRNFGGGIPKGALMVMVGEPGAGKSVICQRLLYGFLKNGHSVSMVNTELTTKAFIEQMRSLDYGVVGYLLNRELLYVPVYPLIGRVKERKDFLSRLMNGQALFERNITIVDTFSSLVKNDIDKERVIKALSFFKKLAGMDKTIILTIDADELDEDILGPFKSDADIFIRLQSKFIEGLTSRSLIITRFLNPAQRFIEVTGFRIEPTRGFIIDITTVA